MIMWRFTWFFTIMVMFIFLQYQLVASSSPAIHLSRNMQKIALFQFKLSLTISSNAYCFSDTPPYESYFPYESYLIPSHPKTMNWSMSSDYCTWEGVMCEQKTRNVIGLDLSCSQLEGAILPNNTLFQLSHLQFLNLSWNNFFLSNQFPQEFGFFAKGLTHLNLSNSQFSGRVPSGISHLYKLVSLDLSGLYSTKLENEVFQLLLQNLTQLRVLNLDSVNISSVLPMNLSTSLRILDLRYTNLYGVLPQEVFHLPNLEVLDLTVYSINLTVILPKVKWGSSGSLQHLYLGGINLYEGIPDSIAFLESLATLILSHCNLSRPIPTSIGNLTRLTTLGLWANHLSGPIPKFLTNYTNIRVLDLSRNNLIGPFPSWVSHLRELIRLDLRNNSLTGPLPSWLFELPSLNVLYIGHNGFTGQLYEFNSSNSQLQYLSCTHNLLYGPIPQSFSQLVNLVYLDLSSNNFSLEYSHKSTRSTTMATLPPNLFYLDLSNNQIEGEISHWFGSVDSLFYLNISHNRLTGGLEQLPWNNIGYLDLQSNMLNGSLPSLICNATYLEIFNLSHNNFSGELPICPTNLTGLSVFDLRMNNIQGNLPSTLSNFPNLKSINLHGNKLEGKIPSSFAEFDYLETLDLGNNQINDTFPHCLEALPNLQVLVLKSNKFRGHINMSSNIEHPFPSLRIIDLSYNEFSGPLPAKYFKNFRAMMNGDVNKIKATYMGQDLSFAFYRDSTALVIKGVEIEMVRILTVFTTIDLSRNNFEGEIAEHIGNLVSLRYLNLSHNHLTGHIPSSIGKLSMLESLDLSFNRLEGEIPQQLTTIYSLARLNLSQNQLSGHIPQGPQFNTFENDSYVDNLGLCGYPLSKECEHHTGTQEEEEDEDDDYFFSGFTWEAVVIGYGCGVVPAFIIGNLMLLAGKPKWFAGIIARELGLKIRRMEIRMR